LNYTILVILEQFSNSIRLILTRYFIIKALSGTGKTGAFTIAALQVIDTGSKNIQALIVAPTRELSLQIAFVIQSIGEYQGAIVHACVGGTSVREDIKLLK